MTPSFDRRDFVLGGVAALPFLSKLPALQAADVQARELVRLEPDVEPLVKIVEDTPREKLMEVLVSRIKSGTNYQELLTALMLAGVRGIQPRPVGFKFHAVLVVNSAHLATLQAQDRERWLPLLWAFDNFKNSQARNRQEGDWRMAPLEEGQLPASHQAGERFRDAMEQWDETGADRAVAAWSRSASLNEVYEAFWRFGARDFRDIGHKAIFVANSYRTLQTIGWRHAEPILRSLAYALLEHEGTNPAKRDDPRDTAWRDNLGRAAKIRAGWQKGNLSREASEDLLSTLRTATPAEGSDKAMSLLNKEIDPASVWDGLFLTAGELLMRQPGIVGLHCVTTANALYYAYHTSAVDETRKMMLLQAAAFLPMFRQAMVSRGKLNETIRLDRLEPLTVSERAPAAVEEILTDISKDRLTAARKTLTLAKKIPGGADALMSGARRLVFLKGNDSHDYKFCSAALEDFYHATPAWRDQFLASSMFHLKGAGSPDTELVKRIQAALA